MDAGGFSQVETGAARPNGETDRLKVFLSYSRDDIDFADQMVMLLEAKGFQPVIDRHDIDAAEKWKQRLGDLIFSCDTVIFVLSETSARSPICAWEVEHAAALRKRMIPILPRPCAVPAPPQLAELNYINMFRDPALPGTSFSDGMEKLDRALKVDLTWLRTATRLAERAAEWRRSESDDRLLRGRALTEAEEWLAHIPPSAALDPDTRAYLDASAEVETRRTSEAARQLAEREEALSKAESAAAEVAAAYAARVKSSRRFRAFALIALVVGIGLAVSAGAAAWLAAENNAKAEAARTEAEAARGEAEFARTDAEANRTQARELLARAVESEAAAADALETASSAVAQGNENLALEADTRAAAIATFADAALASGQPAAAMLLSLYADPAAQHVVSAVKPLRPHGLSRARESLVRTFMPRPLVVLSGHTGPIGSAEFSPNGELIVTSSPYDGTARIWDVGKGKSLRIFSGSGRNASFSPDGSRVLVTGDAHTVRIWDASNGASLATLSGHENIVSGAVFSPDGKRVVTASWDKTARVWDAPTGSSLAVLAGHSREVTGAAFSPDGSRIVTASADGVVHIWDTQTGRAVHTFSEGATDWMYGAEFSPDGASVIAVSGKTVRIWDTLTGKILVALQHPDFVSNAEFSPDGRRVFTSSDDGNGRIWDSTTGEVLAILKGHSARIVSSRLSADGTRFVTASDDSTFRVWDALTGEFLYPLSAGYFGEGMRAVFSPDGRGLLVVGGTDASVMDANPKFHLKPATEQVRLACSRLRELGIFDFAPEERAKLRVLDGVPPYPCGPPPVGVPAWPPSGRRS